MRKPGIISRNEYQFNFSLPYFRSSHKSITPRQYPSQAVLSGTHFALLEVELGHLNIRVGRVAVNNPSITSTRM